MANSTAAANANAGGDSSSTSGTVTENAVAAQQAARQMKQYMTCMEYKIADPSLKSGVYVLSACDSNVDPSRRTYVVQRMAAVLHPYSILCHISSSSKQSFSLRPVEVVLYVLTKRSLPVYALRLNRHVPIYGPRLDESVLRHGN